MDGFRASSAFLGAGRHGGAENDKWAAGALDRKRHETGSSHSLAVEGTGVHRGIHGAQPNDIGDIAPAFCHAIGNLAHMMGVSRPGCAQRKGGAAKKFRGAERAGGRRAVEIFIQ
jgi:hypothetical protein